MYFLAAEITTLRKTKFNVGISLVSSVLPDFNIGTYMQGCQDLIRK